MANIDDRYEEADSDDFAHRRRPQATSGQATASLICGILSFCIPLVAAIAAIVLGILAVSNINKSRGRLSGQGLAIAGIVLGCLGLVIPISVALLLPAVLRVRDAADRAISRNNLKQLALALQGYHDQYGHYPSHANYRADGKPLLSWRVHVLPYMEYDNLYKQFKLDEPWDSPNNRPLLEHMPHPFAQPYDRRNPSASSTYYQVFVGPQAAFEGSTGIRQQDMVDGLTTTLLVVEAGEPVLWTKPVDLLFAPNQPLPKLGGIFRGDFSGVMADGTVHFFKKDTNEQLLRALITRNGHERIDPNDIP